MKGLNLLSKTNQNDNFQSFRLETWHAQFGHLIKSHPVKTVVIRQ